MKIVPFVEKRPSEKKPWVTFGARRELYELWAPHICGICGLSSTLKFMGVEVPSLWWLTQLAIDEKVFIIQGDGIIRGAYHHPLARLAIKLGLESHVFGDFRMVDVANELVNGGFVLLSVSLNRINPSLQGSHLVLIHSYLPENNTFILHDCAHVMRNPGFNITMKKNEIAQYSNERGVIFRPQFY